MWLRVSSFNVGARAFHERHGYRVAAQLDDLINDGKNEMLMRKKVIQTAASLWTSTSVSGSNVGA
jgi:ribosomal protein S18 acetylase RimI-like enzyme